MASQSFTGMRTSASPSASMDGPRNNDGTTEDPAVLMLGKGWFPEQLGGLDRYYRDLLEHLPEAHGLVLGPAPGSPERLVAVSRHDAPLPARLLALWRAARCSREAVVVDAHFALYALLPLLSKRLRSLPLVVHFQGPWADENVSAGDGSHVRRAVRRMLERCVYRRADRAIVLTSAFRRVLVERYHISPWRIHVVPPGVDLTRFSPGDRRRARESLNLEHAPFVAVAVRRLVPRMGLDVLIEAWSRASSALPADSQLLIAGDGAQLAPLEQQVQRLGVSRSVQLLGRVPDDALVDLYRAADVGVVPTRSFEGFGLVVIEAAGCGTPTIVTEVGGLPEAVDALDPSLAVQPEDVDALARRLVIAASPGGLPTRGATRRFAEQFSWSRAVSRNRAVIREALHPDAHAGRMRVAYLDHVAELSGGELALLRLLPHLDEIEPHVILARDGPFADRLVQAGISTEVLPMLKGAQSLSKDRVTARTLPVCAVASTVLYIVRLAIRLHRLQPDVVHANSLKSGLYGSVAARLAGIPVVWHVRDRISADYLPRPAVRAIRWATRWLPTAVVVNSAATGATLDPRVSPLVLHSVLAECPTNPAVRTVRGSHEFVVGMVGRLAPWKGQDLLLRAFANAFAESQARCILVGSSMFGEDEYVLRLHDLVNDLGLEGKVDFRGFRNDIWQELDRMDLLVHASLIPEPFGQVVLEGMAAGVPVVAADAGGPAEILRNDINGVLYPMGDCAALAAALKSLAPDAERRARLAEGGRATVAAYHPDAVVAPLQTLYRGMGRSPRLPRK